LDWYKQHYQKAKGEPFRGRFGYRFNPPRNSLDLDYTYDYVTGLFSITSVPPLDYKVPLDKCILSLANSARIDVYSAPALRLVVLIGRVQDSLPYIANYVFAPIGTFRLLAQSPQVLDNERRKQLLDDLRRPSPGIFQGYFESRKRQKMRLYWQVIQACLDWICDRRERIRLGKKAPKKGYLQWIAKKLVKDYGWKSQPESYTVLRYLDRARELWHWQAIEETLED